MSNTQPLISVITPYYESSDLLKETIESVREQTYTNWEMIVVDDCSPTNPSKEIVESIGDARIKSYKTEQNSGTGKARNLAVSQSIGEYLLILDADDLLAPNYMEAVLGLILKENADAGYTFVKRFGLRDEVSFPKATIPEIFAGGFPFNTLMLRRSLFEETGGYVSDLVMEDTEFWLRALKTGKKFVLLPEPLYFYRMRPGSRIQSSTQASHDFFQLQLKHVDTMKENLEEVIRIWQKNSDEAQAKGYPKSDLQIEYEHLHSEFHALLKRYNTLEKQNARNEKILSRFSLLQKQLTYLVAKKMGLR